MGCISSKQDTRDVFYNFDDGVTIGVNEGIYMDDPRGSSLKYCSVDFRASQVPTAYRAPRPRVGTCGGCGGCAGCSECCRMWTDKDFPYPSNTDVYYLDWKRPHNIVANPVLFAEGPDKSDINQGNFGTCWFLSMLSNIAEDRDLLKKVISERSYTPKTDGIFHCRLWRLGIWEDVYIDDFLPVHDGSRFLMSAGSGSGNGEMWVSLMEKALAKFHGSYSVLEGGWPSDAYLALTGGVPETIRLRNTSYNPEQLYRRVLTAVETGALVTCAIFNKVVPQDLVGQHAYSLNGADVVTTFDNARVPLLRLRNPHGQNEWTGRWSDTSDEWRSVREGKELLQRKDDGEFWMSLADFTKYFQQITICSLTPDFDIDGGSDHLNYVLRIFGEWRTDTSTGQGRTLTDRLRNPRFSFAIPNGGEEVPVVVHLIQGAGQHEAYHDIRCDLFKVMSDDDRSVFVTKMQDTEAKEHYFRWRQCTFRYRLRPGNYIVVPSTCQSATSEEFLVRVFSPCPLYDCRSIRRDKLILPYHRR
ncbi:calpain-A-like [Haliotis cracherodii]|uniref:calpain-A-like n=1 Tax=Haliotis cracherodii TaxID=6455 RepID=UPI0039E869C2